MGVGTNNCYYTHTVLGLIPRSGVNNFYACLVCTLLLPYHTLRAHQLHFILPHYRYIHSGSPNVTSLTFDDQSRTLTCTSTGGPATNVTWRRDGIVITLNATHQQTKSLVDPVNGTYKTILTINSSVDQSDIVGTYSCTVENDRGESSGTVVVTGETCSLATFLLFAYTTVFDAHIPLYCRKTILLFAAKCVVHTIQHTYHIR